MGQKLQEKKSAGIHGRVGSWTLTLSPSSYATFLFGNGMFILQWFRVTKKYFEMSYWSWDLVFQDRSNTVRGDFLLWKHLFFRITFSALMLIQDHKTNFFQTLKGCC